MLRLPKGTKGFLGVLSAAALLLAASGMTSLRWDLTEDHRFTLSEASQKLLKGVTYPMQAEILLGEELPSGFRRLKEEARGLLHSLREKNPQLSLVTTALSEAKKSEKTLETLKRLGITPTQLQVNREGTRVDKLIFPWIVLRYRGRLAAVPMLNAQQGVSPAEQLEHSAQVLEYELSNAIRALCVRDKPKIAFYHAEGETSGASIAAARAMLQRFYQVDDFFFRDTTAIRSRFDSLLQYRALLINNPRSAFSENSKYLIDQYIQHGGRVLWAVGAVAASLDSLRASGRELAYVKDLNLTDLLFCYGVRINPVLVKDLRAAPLTLAVGKTGNRTNFRDFLWPYSPLVFPESTHPLVKNIQAVRFVFPSALDTLATTGLKKTPLLWSSRHSAREGLPAYIDLNALRHPVDRNAYQGGKRLLALALEGRFPSAYQDRIKPLKGLPFQAHPKPSKMVVFASGALFENQSYRGQALALGYDKWTNQHYGNGALLRNSLSWLTEDSGLIGLRSKQLKMRRLDRRKISQSRGRWQVLNLGLPLLWVMATGLGFRLYRRKRFGRPKL